MRSLLALTLLPALGGCWVSDEGLQRALDRDGDGFVVLGGGGGDCDDSDPTVHPDAAEVCGDGIDNNCDGRVDDLGVGARTFYLDEDGDGFGATPSAIDACAAPDQHVAVGGDCDDRDPTIHPSAPERCDGRDTDCDGEPDDGLNFIAYWPDHDGDGFGLRDASPVTACAPPPQSAPRGGDCDDDDPAVNPDALDACTGRDDDCDGVVDDDAVFQLYFRDGDGDGRGDPLVSLSACGAPEGWVAVGGDCDDGDPTINDLAPDTCNGVDDNCDGLIDNQVVFQTYFPDADQDGFGALPAVSACQPLPGHSLAGGDCDDDDPLVHPGVVDTCDGVDSDCDGTVDNDGVFTLYYLDLDGDGFGNPSTGFESCGVEPDVVLTTGDCDDDDPNIRPDAPDPCDGIDNDCDGSVDEDAPFATWFADADGDGLGDASAPLSFCGLPPAGYVASPGDCDDDNPAITLRIWYADADGDGFGAGDPLVACDAPDAAVSNDRDCDDSDGQVNPSRDEVCGDGKDNDCSVATDCRWRGTWFASQATWVVPPAANPRGVLTDINGDGLADWWVATASGTRLYHGDGTPPTFTGPPDILLPPGCQPQQVVGRDGHDLVCVLHDRVTLHTADQLSSGVGNPMTTVLSGGAPGFGQLVTTSRQPPTLWIGDATQVAMFRVQPGTFAIADTSGVFRPTPPPSSAVTVPTADGDAFIAVAGDQTLNACPIPSSGTFDPDECATAVAPTGATWSLSTVAITPWQTVSQLVEDDESGARVMRSFAQLEPYELGEPFGDRRAESYPNEVALARPTGDIVGDGTLDWVFETGEVYKRTGIAYAATAGVALTSDVDAWFVDDGGGDLQLIAALDVSGDGRIDLVFRDDAGAMLVFVRDVQ